MLQRLAGREVGDRVVPVAGADGQDALIVAGRTADADALVPDGDDRQDTPLEDGVHHGQEVLPEAAEAERQIQDAGAVLHGPVHAGQNAGEAVAAFDDHGAEQLRPRRDAERGAADGRADDRTGGVRAVNVAVHGIVAGAAIRPVAVLITGTP